MESFVASRTALRQIDLPMTAPGKMIFSFSGIKSAVKRELDKTDAADLCQKHAIASAFQAAAVGQLEARVKQALSNLSQLQLSSLVVSGGVASNMFLRAR